MPHKYPNILYCYSKKWINTNDVLLYNSNKADDRINTIKTQDKEYRTALHDCRSVSVNTNEAEGQLQWREKPKFDDYMYGLNCYHLLPDMQRFIKILIFHIGLEMLITVYLLEMIGFFTKYFLIYHQRETFVKKKVK